jgi:CRP-like cAMP-binding protein
MFEFVSVDELFRVASLGEETRYSSGRELFVQGSVPQHVHFLLEGTVRHVTPAGVAREIAAPAVIGLENVLQGAPMEAAVTALGAVACLQVQSSDFLTMVSDNPLLAESLVGMLLSEQARDGFHWLVHTAAVTDDLLGQPLDQALALREHPLLARATPAQLLAVVTAAREVALDPDSVLFDAEDPAALFQVLQGEVLVKESGGLPRSAGPGTALGVAETLAGVGFGCSATVAAKGRALMIDRESLFGILTDDVDLLQAVFSEVLAQKRYSPVAQQA